MDLGLIGASYSLSTSEIHYDFLFLRWLIEKLSDHGFHGMHAKPVTTIDQRASSLRFLDEMPEEMWFWII